MVRVSPGASGFERTWRSISASGMTVRLFADSNEPTSRRAWEIALQRRGEQDRLRAGYVSYYSQTSCQPSRSRSRRADPRGLHSQRRAGQLSAFPPRWRNSRSSLPAPCLPPETWSFGPAWAPTTSRFFVCPKLKGYPDAPQSRITQQASWGSNGQLGADLEPQRRLRVRSHNTIKIESRADLNAPHRSSRRLPPTRAPRRRHYPPHCSREQRLPPHPGSHQQRRLSYNAPPGSYQTLFASTSPASQLYLVPHLKRHGTDNNSIQRREYVGPSGTRQQPARPSAIVSLSTAGSDFGKGFSAVPKKRRGGSHPRSAGRTTYDRRR